jgi:putative effector of murein hydrolase
MAEKFAFIWMVLALPIYSDTHAASWNWVIFANILLGISQGLTWSSTVMKWIWLEKKIVDWRWDSTSLPAISPLD